MTLRQKYQEAWGEVTSLRDMVKVQAHLFSLDARERLRELERTMESAEQTMAHEGEEMAEMAMSKLKRAADLGQQLFHELIVKTDFRETSVSSIMTKTPVTCGPFDSLEDAARLMWDTDCGAVPVVDDDQRVVGMLTDRDVAMSAFLTGRRLSEEQVRRAMSDKVVSTSERSSLSDVLRVMGIHQLHRIPVVNAEDRLAGIVSLADIARALSGSENDEAARALLACLASISAPPQVT